MERNNSMIPERLARLRTEMEKRHIAAYVVPTADFHESEYVGEHFKARKYITGFSGSAGTAVITMTEAGLWTDGRYFLQAEKQLAGTGVTLYKMGEEGVPTVMAYLRSALGEGAVLGFDGRVINAALGRQFEALVKEKKGSLAVDEDLIGLIWEDRPPLSCRPAWVLPEKYSGRPAAEKLAAVRAAMAEAGAEVHLLSCLYDEAWLLNVRGGDIDSVPVVLSYLALTADKCFWFVQEAALDDEVKAYLSGLGVEVRPYESFYDYAAALPAGTKVLLDPKVCNTRLLSALSGAALIEKPNPTVRMRAIKNPVEQANNRLAHQKDARAMISFLYWLKTNVGKIPMTEISVSDYLAARRAEQEGFLDLSFSTIAGYNAHGAVIHYSATPETDAPLEPHGLLLVDTGGHYREGTTDITRTIALGPVSDEMKSVFTRVLRSHLQLANARFLYGCTGVNLDVLARGPMWEADLDYKHGTGHGVGHILNVHEGPNGFRWRPSPDRSEGSVLEEGMVTTDEPGLYFEGKFGVRIESELLCRKGVKNEYGQFMYFENLTCVPIDLDAVDPAQLNETERRQLNEYHAMVWEVVAPQVSEEERSWLKNATRPI